MKKFFEKYLSGLFFSGFIVSGVLAWGSFSAAADTSSQVTATILPGVFYMSVYGDLQSGIGLSGLSYAGSGPQTGYWNANMWEDYISFFDSSPVPGFRIQFSLNSDFIYSGSYPDQGNLPAGNFISYADWDENSNSPLPPQIGVDASVTAAAIDSAGSWPQSFTSNYAKESGKSSIFKFFNDFGQKAYSFVDQNKINLLLIIVILLLLKLALKEHHIQKISIPKNLDSQTKPTASKKTIKKSHTKKNS